MHYELVLIDQSQFRQRQRELHASHEQSLTRLLLELLNGSPQIPAHELRVPIDPLQGARHDVLLCRIDRPGEGFHPIRHLSRRRRRSKPCLHHFVSHPAKEEGISLQKVLDRVTMHLFVRDNCPMITAPVQCDVDGIPKGSHYIIRFLISGHRTHPPSKCATGASPPRRPDLSANSIRVRDSARAFRAAPSGVPYSGIVSSYFSRAGPRPALLPAALPPSLPQPLQPRLRQILRRHRDPELHVS